MTNTFIGIERLDSSFLSVKKLDLDYTEAVELQCRVSFAKIRMKGNVDYMMPSR